MKKKRYTTLFIVLHAESMSVGQRLIHNARSVPSVSRCLQIPMVIPVFPTFPGSVAPVSCRRLSGVAAGPRHKLLQNPGLEVPMPFQREAYIL